MFYWVSVVAITMSAIGQILISPAESKRFGINHHFKSFSADGDIVDARSQLSDLTQLPLFLPPTLGRQVASSERLSSAQVSEPSLSWIREQLGKRYGSDRLVVQWQAYQAFSDLQPLSYVDVVVDEQIWSLLSYFERYAFIAQFGTVAKQYGYHLRVFHSGDLLNYDAAQTIDDNPLITLRGAYICQFPSIFGVEPVATSPDVAAAIPCDILLDEASRREIR